MVTPLKLDLVPVLTSMFEFNLVKKAPRTTLLCLLQLSISSILSMLMAWLLASISELVGHVVRCTSSRQIRLTLEQLASENSTARLLQLRFQLQSVKKGSMNIDDYVLKMRSVADNLNAASQVISNDDLVLYILGGLGSEYDLVVANLTSRK